MTEPTNIIKFPKENKNFQSLESLEELKTQAIENKLDFVEFVSEELSDQVLYQLTIMGFRFDNDENVRDVMMLNEVVKSLILRCMAITHELQSVADTQFKEPKT